MNPRIRLTVKLVCRFGLFLLLSLLTLNCVLWDLGGEEIAQDVFSGTYTKIAYEQTQLQREIEEDNARNTEWADFNNAESTRQAAEYQTLLAAPSPTASSPVIQKIEFPSRILGNKETHHGKLFFQDADGDVNRLTLEVIKAINFGGADYDPNPYLISGDYTLGVFQLYVWCEGAQDVTLRATLYDQSGLRSNSVEFSFTCE